MTFTVDPHLSVSVVVDGYVPDSPQRARVRPIFDVTADDLDENGVVFACRTSDSANKVASLCTDLWERGSTSVLLRLLPCGPWPHHAASSVLDVDDPKIWDTFLSMFAATVGRHGAEATVDEIVPWRHGTASSHLRGDARHGAFLPALRAHLRATPRAQSLIAPEVAEAEHWPGNWGAQLLGTELVTVHPNNGSWTEALVFTEAAEMPDTRGTHRLEPEWLRPDERPFHGSLEPPHDLSSTATTLAQAHLAHDCWKATLLAVEAAAQQDAAQLADRVLDLLGDRDEPVDPHHDKLCRLAADAA